MTSDDLKELERLCEADIQRFNKYILKTEHCWLWNGSTSGVAKGKKGYGTFRSNGKNRRATHISWELANNKPFPKGLFACHKCDNPPCVNPDHIFIGNHKDNAQDALAKGRLYAPVKTHCKYGHKFYKANTKWSNDRKNRKTGKKRICKICESRRLKKYRTSSRARLKEETNNLIEEINRLTKIIATCKKCSVAREALGEQGDKNDG